MAEGKYNELVLDFDLSLIEHLGSQLYTTLPPIISELISNAYDADATNVNISFIKKENGFYDLIVQDNGNGIAYGVADESDICNEIVKRYLTVRRKKRIDENSDFSPIYKRKLQGKKGIGKLAGFGISNKIEIETISQKIKNKFILDYDEMIEITKESGNIKYYPEHKLKNISVEEENGTTIRLHDLKRKSEIIIDDLAKSIAKRLQIFDDNFNCTISNGLDEKQITNKLFLEYIKENKGEQFVWRIPEDLNRMNLNDNVINFINRCGVHGEIITSITPLPKDHQGIVLYARNKMAQDGYMFNERANDNFYSYLYGSLVVDYIDEDRFVDNIATARGSLVWEKDIAIELQKYIHEIIVKIQSEWRTKRKEDKKEEVKKNSGIDCEAWIESLNKIEQKTARTLVEALLENSDLSTQSTAQYIEYVKDFFEFDSFKSYASSIIEKDKVSVTDAIEIVKTWEFIEAKELSKVSTGRINAIDTFEKMINDNESESKSIQPFLEKFPWILDPAIENFQRELTFSKMLKENFPDEALEESDRRLDFFVQTTHDSYIVYELKRPSVKIKQDYLDQCTDYITFAREKLPRKQIEKCILVVGQKRYSGKDDREKKRTEENVCRMINNGDFDVKTYSELISTSRSYNNEIIRVYKNLQEIKDKNIL